MRRDRAYYVAAGRLAWEQGDTRPPPKGWQGEAWAEGFNAAYERDRPGLDLDGQLHEAEVAERRASFRVVS